MTQLCDNTNAQWLAHSHSISLIMQFNSVDEEISSMKLK